MPAFNDSQLKFFSASSGAYSIVTNREATGDKSVTVDKTEKAVLSERIALTEFTRAGGAKDDGKPAKHMFNVFNIADKTSDFHHLAIKYPKAQGNELRLYFYRDSEFYPESGDIWFIFVRDGEDRPYIGFSKKAYWDGHISGDLKQKQFVHDYSLDEEDEKYQKDVASPQLGRDSSTVTVNKHNRSAALGQKVCSKAGYKCQYNSDHETFISASTGDFFVEPHHFIPVSRNTEFEYDLDVEENIIVLCPNCHRAIHYGDIKLRQRMIDRFYGNRIEGLRNKKIDVTLHKIYEFYGVNIKP